MASTLVPNMRARPSFVSCKAQMSARLSLPTRRMLPSRWNRRALLCSAAAVGGTNPRTQRLRELLKGDDILKGPCCHDALSARLIEQAGFPYAFMSGFCTSAARLGAPDTGLISYYEMMDQGRYVHEATKSIPIIGDGDTGYGNALNVKRTVRGYANAGFAGILIEDQLMPKSCGHVKGKKVVSREEAVARIRAAVDAREEGADILILARTDARQAVSLDEALWRAAAFAEAGADILFIDALESREEMLAFANLQGAKNIPKMANMLEGGGKTPILPPAELQRLGFKLVAYPLSLLGVSIRSMQLALERLQEDKLPGPSAMGSFLDIQRAVGFPEYYEEANRYAVLPSGDASSTAGTAAPPVPEVEPQVAGPASGASRSPGTASAAAAASASASDGSYSAAASAAGPGSPGASSAPPEVEPDAVILVPSTARGSSSNEDKSKERDRSYRRDRFFRVKISDLQTGVVKLETRIPAGFLQGLGAVVPQTAGMNVEALMQQALGEGRDLSEPLISFNSTIDKIQIFLE